MNKLILAIIFSAFTMISKGQNSTCNNTRYLTQEFTNVTSTTGVLFGNSTTFSGSNQDLFMDIYEPQGDVASKRPVLILAFGGSFIGGVRSDIASLCEHYAKRGFVTVTVDYRLYDGPLFPFPSAAQMTDVTIRAMGDMKAAIRFLKKDAATSNSFKIDTNNVFVGGVSNGAIIATMVTYLDILDTENTDVNTALSNNGGLEGNSNSDFEYSSKVHGVLSFSGAIFDTNFIDLGEPPVFMVHDDQDETIPSLSGFVNVFSLPTFFVHGSNSMALRASNAEVDNHLISIPNSTDHVSYFQANSAAWEDSVHNESAKFLHDIVCSGVVLHTSTSEDKDALAVYPNPNYGLVNLDFGNKTISSLKVLTIDGRLIINNQRVNSSKHQFSIDEKPGIYVLEVLVQGKKKHYRILKE